MTTTCVKAGSSRSVIGHLHDIHQSLLIAETVVQYVGRYRQSTLRSKEAGGQLFGTISTGQICVTVASGPYSGDEQSRYRYRSNSTAAQSTIDDCHMKGLLYLGEWHTHAEDHPRISTLDDDAMRRLIANSQLNISALLILIVGRAEDVTGLGMWSVSSEFVHPWILTDST